MNRLAEIRKSLAIACWFMFLTFPILVIRVTTIENIIEWRWLNMFYVGVGSFLGSFAWRYFLARKGQGTRKASPPGGTSAVAAALPETEPDGAALSASARGAGKSKAFPPASETEAVSEAAVTIGNDAVADLGVPRIHFGVNTGELLTLGAGADRFESVADRGPAAPVSLLAEIPAVPAWPIDRERIDESGARLKILTVSSTPPILIEAANSLAARLEQAGTSLSWYTRIQSRLRTGAPIVTRTRPRGMSIQRPS